MLSKLLCVYEIVKGYGLVYEVAGQYPRKYPRCVEDWSNICEEMGDVGIADTGKSAADMALEYLDWIYQIRPDSPRPDWWLR